MKQLLAGGPTFAATAI